MSLDAIFKAYDIRGLYPEELDEALARRIGNAFAHFTGAQQLIVGRDMRPRRSRSRPRSSKGRRLPAPTSPTSACARPTSCTSRRAGSTRRARCSPRATTRRSTTASRCAARARRRWVSKPGLQQIKELVAVGRDVARRVAGQGRAPRSPRRVRRARPLVRRRLAVPAAKSSSPTPPTAWAGSSCPRCSKACPSR